MKKCIPLLLALLLFTACASTPSASQPASQPPSSSAPAPSVPEEAPASSQPAGLAEEEKDRLVQVLQKSDYAYWAGLLIPQDPAVQAYLVNYEGYYIPYTLVTVASWSQTGAGGAGPVDGAAMKQAALDLYGVEYDLSRAKDYPEGSGQYEIPAHGPMHISELLPETAAVEGDTLTVDTDLSNVTYGEGETYHATMRHTFAKNPEGAAFPYRLLSVEEVESTYPLVYGDVQAPTNVYDAPTLGLVNVDELNLRAGPGTDYDKVTLLTKDTLISFVGDDGGEWLCSGSGWVKAKYITIVGALG